jgi:hypothetical protein
MGEALIFQIINSFEKQLKMEYSGAIETIGSITKMENITSVEENILQNTLVLRNIDPFPGYHLPKKGDEAATKSGSTFIVLRHRYSPEKINKINKDLIASRITECFPSFGEIITRESIFPCIRIKDLQNDDQIILIQNFFIRNGLQLTPYRKIEGNARIKIFKTFRLIEIAEGLYRDLNNGVIIYIRTSHALNWKQFDEITRKIKLNMDNRNFDAALGIIYRFCGPEDVIRVYDQNKTLERALQLKKYYLKEIKRSILISVNHNYLDE